MNEYGPSQRAQKCWVFGLCEISDVVACQPDVPGAERGDVLKVLIGNAYSIRAEAFYRGFQIFCVPHDDRGHEEVEARCLLKLMLIAAIPQFTQLIEEDAPRASISRYRQVGFNNQTMLLRGIGH